MNDFFFFAFYILALVAWAEFEIGDMACCSDGSSRLEVVGLWAPDHNVVSLNLWQQHCRSSV